MNHLFLNKFTFFSELVALGLDVALKATVILLLAWSAHLALGRRRALMRSAIWNACLVGLMLLPAVSLALPRLQLVWLPESERATSPIADPDPETKTETVSNADKRSNLAASRPVQTEDPELLFAALDWYERTVVAPRLDSPPVSERPGFFTEAPTTQAPRVDVADVTEREDASASAAVASGSEAPSTGAGSPAPWIALGYLAVAGLLGLRLLASLVSVARLKNSARPVAERAWLDDLARWRERLGIRASVTLGATDRLTVPVVVGWLRPMILLPPRLIEAATPETRSAVLLHELAHVRRGDYVWNLLARVVRLVHWPHPLVWPMGAAIRANREQACDDLCVHFEGGPDRYRSALLEIVASRVHRPGPALGLAMARPSRLSRRLAWIDRSTGSPRCLSRWPLRLGLLAAVVALSGLIGVVELTRASGTAPGMEAQKQEDAAKETGANDAREGAPATEQPAPDAPPEVVEIIVKAADTGEPLPGAIARSFIDFEIVEAVAGEEGRARIDRSGAQITTTSLAIDVWANGYVQQRYSFSEDNPRSDPIPRHLTVELLPGNVEIGGIVQNEEGDPIAGAVVQFQGWLEERENPRELCFWVRTITDESGRWRSRSARKMSRVDLELSHPDYVSDLSYTRRFDVPIDELKKGTNVQVMERGVSVNGRVVDQDGQPIAGAIVAQSITKEANSRETIQLKTDAKGRFEFAHTPVGEVYLVAKADGYAPNMIPLTVEPDKAPDEVTFRLGAPRVLEGRVVEPNGNPVVDALVYVNSWRNIGFLGVRMTTDADGRFRWESAPPDPVRLTITKRFYETIYQRSATAGEPAREYNFRPTMDFTGTIRDAETGERIKRAEVSAGYIDPENGEITWREPKQGSVSSGRLYADVPMNDASQIKLRISAPQYGTLVSEPFEPSQRLVAFDGELSKIPDADDGDVVTGVVRRPDGEPLADATVAVSTGVPNVWVPIDSGKVLDPTNKITQTETDAQGRFTLPAQPEPFTIFAFNDAFMVEASHEDLEKSTELVTRPWGRLEGQAFMGTEPATGFEIHLFTYRSNSSALPNVLNSDSVATDEEGRFQINQVLPGYVGISARRSTEDGDLLGSRQYTIVTVKSGETTKVTIGGQGRPVVGRIATPEDFDRDVDFSESELSLKIESNSASRYVPPDAWTAEDLSRKRHAAYETPESMAYMGGRLQLTRIRISADGSFRVEDIPAGTYRLEFRLGTPANIDRQGRRLAPLKHFFTVPEIPGGRSDEPLDLGVIPMRIQTDPPEPGAPAPDFAVETLDGRTVRLEDYRGKHLLLNFWAPWKDQCLYQIPQFKALREAYDAEELAILHLAPSANADEVREIADKSKLPGDVAFIGQWSDNPILADYAVTWLPELFLIDPDGTLLRSNFRGLYSDGLRERARERLDELLGR